MALGTGFLTGGKRKRSCPLIKGFASSTSASVLWTQAIGIVVEFLVRKAVVRTVYQVREEVTMVSVVSSKNTGDIVVKVGRGDLG